MSAVEPLFHVAIPTLISGSEQNHLKNIMHYHAG